MRIWIGLAVVGFLAGCVSIADVRTNDPYFEGEFAGDFRSVAVCIGRSWETKLTAQMVTVDAANRVAYIRSAPGIIVGAGKTETTVRQVAERRVRVEHRRPSFAVAPPAWMWESVEACADSSV